MSGLAAVVLGSAAGGGVPQWNCRCRICELARRGVVRPRTQTGVAVTGDGETWLLLNAAPELRHQLLATPVLAPREGRGLRDSPVAGAVLTGGEIDQVMGLFHLRESQPFTLFATAAVLTTLDANPLFGALAPGFVERKAVPLAKPFPAPGGLVVECFPVPGKVPLYLEGVGYADHSAAAPTRVGDMVVGIMVETGGRRLAFVPEVAEITREVRARLEQADVVLFDGTVFTDDEMITTGVGTKTGRRMGHVPIAGPDGSLAVLRGLPGRRIYIHINNTNPILIEDSDERRAVERAGVEVAHDGMRIGMEIAMESPA